MSVAVGCKMIVESEFLNIRIILDILGYKDVCS